MIALIGILNFVNAIITEIISRRREFAMLQSIGMTNVQLQKMLMLVAVIVPMTAYRNLRKKSIVERLRESE